MVHRYIIGSHGTCAVFSNIPDAAGGQVNRSIRACAGKIKCGAVGYSNGICRRDCIGAGIDG